MSPTICNPDLLLQSLSDRLSEVQEQGLAQHLEDCDTCRKQLDSLASGNDSWLKIERALRNETTGQHPPAGPHSTLVPVSLVAIDRLHSIGVEIETNDFAVDFLEPSQNKDALGSLNNIEIRAIIGHGGNGIVLKGFQDELNRLVAVKVMAPQLATSAAARKRFAREAQATAAIVHPNVMPILTVHSEGQLPYLVMPYVDCESLQDRIDRESCLPLLDILRIGHQIAKGLAAAHAQGLVHRDVKPANILLEKGIDRVMLTDFGLARAVDDGTLTRPGLIAGTPQYMSPEQAQGNAVDTRSDLFSLGSVLYAMCTGRAPFRAETTYGILKRVIDEQPLPMSPLNSELPAWLMGYVSQLMAKSAASRTETAGDISTTLERCVAHVQQPQANALPETVQAFASKSRKQLKWWIFGIALVGLLTVGWKLWSPGDAGNHNSPGSSVVTSELGDGGTESTSKVKQPNAPPAAVDDEWASEVDLDLEQLDAEFDKLLESLNIQNF